MDPHEELRRNPLAYSDSDSDIEGDVDERRPDRPTLVPSSRRSLRPFLRQRGARDSDARAAAKENGRLVVGWPFHRDVYDPRSDSHRVGPSFGGGFSPCADNKARGVQRRTTSTDPDASKLAEIRDVGLVAAKSKVITRPKNPTERKGSYYRKFLDDVASFDPRVTFAFDPSTASPEWKSHEEWTAFATRPRMLTKLEFQNQRVVRDRRASDARLERTRDDANRRGGVKKTAAGFDPALINGAINDDSYDDDDDDDDDATANAAKRWLGYRDDARPDGCRVFRPSDRTAVLDARDGVSVRAFRFACRSTLRRLQKESTARKVSSLAGTTSGRRTTRTRRAPRRGARVGSGGASTTGERGKGTPAGTSGPTAPPFRPLDVQLRLRVSAEKKTSRTCATTRDDLCALASRLCVESGVLSCVRWSKIRSSCLATATTLTWMTRRKSSDPARRRAQHGGGQLEGKFLVNYHVGPPRRRHLMNGPPPGGWNDDDGDDMERQGDIAVGISQSNDVRVKQKNRDPIHAVERHGP